MTPKTLSILIDLQTKDLTLLQLKKEAGGIPERQEQRKGRLREAVQFREAAEEQAKACDQSIRQVELEVESKQAQISKYKTQQMQAPSNEVYQALEREIATAQEAIAALEDQELEEMSKLEDAQAAVVAAKEAERQAREAASNDVAELDQRLDTIRATFAEVKAEREELATTLDTEVLDRYMALLTKKQEAVLVPIQETSCGGCHMTLSPQILHDAHSGQKWTTCSFCGRLLYDPQIL